MLSITHLWKTFCTSTKKNEKTRFAGKYKYDLDLKSCNLNIILGLNYIII